MQNANNRILLFAGKKVSALANEYYTAFVERSNNGNPLIRTEHEYYQTEIFNAMREELGVSKKRLPLIRLIKGTIS